MTKPALYACRLGRWCKCDDLTRVDCHNWGPALEVGLRVWFAIGAAVLALIAAAVFMGMYLG